eukprot:SAG31_NODE_3674_length_3999_cov_1.230769_4_plen_228_part_00
MALQVAEIAQCDPARAAKALADARDDVELAVTMLLSEAGSSATTTTQPTVVFGEYGLTSGSTETGSTVTGSSFTDEQAELQASLQRQQAELDALAAARNGNGGSGNSSSPVALAPPTSVTNTGVGGGTSMESIGFPAQNSPVSFGDSDSDDESIMPSSKPKQAVQAASSASALPAYSGAPASSTSSTATPDFAAFMAARSALSATVAKPPPNPFASAGPNPFGRTRQ